MDAKQVAHYRIVEKLGVGGMGEVYRAEDTRLGRPVAIKILPAALANDPERMQRLTREAKILATLNHPNVAAIYALEEMDGLRALVLELVPGQNLFECLARRGRMPLEEAVSICRQIAAGLAAAHERGVVHRDVKPANVMITPAGQAKILDFGLAKSIPQTASDSETPTLTKDLTVPGAVMGTVSYMSPEQARGLLCDEQTDIWAFGCVMFELLTGRRLFAAASQTDTLLKIIGTDADLSGLPRETPARIHRLIQRCVRREPKQRLRHIGDALLELEDTTQDFSPPPVAAPGRQLGWRAALGVASLAAAAGLGGWSLRARLAVPATPLEIRVQRLTDLVGLEESPAISPDGKSVAFIAEAKGKRQIWQRLIAGGTPLAITKDDVDHFEPRWSPDSGSLIYYTAAAKSGEAGTIWEIPSLGGTPQRLCNALGPGDLSHDGRSLAFFRFQSEGLLELAVASRDGSRARTVVTLPNALHFNPRWSPDDRQIAFLREPDGPFFTVGLLIADLAGGEPRRAVAPVSLLKGFAWTPDGSRLIFSSAKGSAISYPPNFNLWSASIGGGPPVQLTFGEASYEHPDAGKEGKLVVSRVRTQSDIWKFPVTGPPDENARRGIRITRQTGQVRTVSVSPGETEAVFPSDNGGHVNVWAARLADGAMRPITRDSDQGVLVAVPSWSPRGDLINYLSNRNSATREMRLWLVKPDGSDPRDLDIVGGGVCWSGDGQWLYYQDYEKGVNRIRKVRVDGGQPSTVRTDNAVGCAVAPDGSALYYGKALSRASGNWDFEVRSAKPENGESDHEHP